MYLKPVCYIYKPSITRLEIAQGEEGDLNIKGTNVSIAFEWYTDLFTDSDWGNAVISI